MKDTKRFLDMTLGEVAEYIVERGQKKFRAKQLADWVYGKGIIDAELMKNVGPKVLEFFEFSTSRIVTSQKSKDGSIKILLEYNDGETVEAVIMPSPKRVTACVSTQVGCAIGCRFCASQLGGFKRNLSSGEILEQILQLQKASGQKVTNVVFMGMGEPLANYDATVKAVRALIDEKRFNISARRITVSTIGIPDQILRLAREDMAITLAISLHAPNDELRREIIPYAKNVSIDQIIEAGREFYSSKKREITLEYVLLDGINDKPSHAHELADLAKRLRCNINIIAYNSVAETGFRPPSRDNVNHFIQQLRDNHVNVTLRKSRGTDIDSACGQLRQKH